MSDDNSLKEPDLIGKFLLQGVDYAKKHMSTLIIAGVLVLVGVAGRELWKYQTERTQHRASQALFLALSDATKIQEEAQNVADARPSAPSSAKLQEVIQKHGKTTAAGVALLYQARDLGDEGKWAEASELYAQAKQSLPMPLSVLALEGQAVGATALNDLAKAESLWRSLADQESNPLREWHTYQLGLCLEQSQKTEQAKQLYDDFEKRFAQSELLPRIKQRRAGLS